MRHEWWQWKIHHLDIRVCPCYIHIAQPLNPSDYQQQIRFFEDMIRKLEENDDQVMDERWDALLFIGFYE